MTAKIREYAVTRFAFHLPQLKELGNTEFRRNVMQDVMKEHSVSLASSATAYNHALHKARAETPEAVLGLGRDPSKIGGRKKKEVSTVATETTPVVELVTVVKVKNGEVVATDLTREDAQKFIAAAKAAKKSALRIQESVLPETMAATEETTPTDQEGAEVLTA